MRPSYADLPQDLITRVKELLLPYARTVDTRDSLITEAFYLYEPRLYNSIMLEGAPDVFCVQCVRKLIDFGCIKDNDHALARLLGIVRRQSGLEDQAKIDELAIPLNRLCDQVSYITEAAPVDQPLSLLGSRQNLATPPAERSPTVFVTFAAEDKRAAKRVIEALQQAGHAVWLDETEQYKRNPGNTEWVRTISEGINNSYAVLAIVSLSRRDDRPLGLTLKWAREKERRIFAALLDDFQNEAFLDFPVDDIFLLHHEYESYLNKLIHHLPSPKINLPSDVGVNNLPTPHRFPSRRALELEYLDRLRLEELLNTDKYTPLAGSTHREARITLGAVVMRQEFEHLAWRENRQQSEPPRKFENAVDELLAIRRAAVLGEPGAGKSTTLWKLARHLLDAAMDDQKQPIPLLIKLGLWTDAQQSLPAFIASQLGELGSHLPDLLRESHAALLLDGLNEVPAGQRSAKARQIRAFLNEEPQHKLIAVVTCREQDYSQELRLDRVAITPLDPLRIRSFTSRYLGQEPGETLFWKIVGEKGKYYETWFRKKQSKLNPTRWEQVFWQTDWYSIVDGNRFKEWRTLRDDPASLLQLARNPYMLFMLVRVYQQYGDLPANRGKLFEQFVETLLLREGAAEQDAGRKLRLLPTGERLLPALEKLAYAMQTRRVGRKRISDDAGEAQSALTVLQRSEAGDIMNNQQLLLAASASILEVGSEVRFTHQLLQEYFAACYMRREIDAGRLRAHTLWPPNRFWERTGWEEATVLFAGLYGDDCTRVVEWVAQANPEVAAQCIVRSGANLPLDALVRITTPWVPMLTDIQRYPCPEARAAFGRALGLIAPINGFIRDTRKGVGLTNGQLPDIDWVEIPAGEFLYQNEKKRQWLDAFTIARYPITYTQFQAFIDAPDGFHNPRWWEGLSADDEDRSQPGEQTFKYWNHPRETVSWYDAIAFCRWLSEKLGDTVMLPTEAQWERAARFTDGREYPWGNGYKDGFANTSDEQNQVGQTTAAGIYPQGASHEGVLDLSGNVWEWCLNEYDKPQNTLVSGAETRVLRGGAWTGDRDVARAAFRFWGDPDARGSGVGFRVVRAPVP